MKFEKNGKHEEPQKPSSLERFAEKYRNVYSTLDEQEIELLRLIALEKSDADTLENMEISTDLLAQLRKSLQQKLSAQSRADYVKFALAFGLISF